jgi:uncharacterized membrane protein
MIKSISPIFRYLLVCVVLFAIAKLSPLSVGERFYKFDRAHVFLEIFFAALFVVGIAFGAHRSRNWGRAVLFGALTGLVSGLLAQAVVVIVNGIPSGLFKSGSVLDLIFSLAMGTIIFLTPLWGVVSACVARAFGGSHATAY